MNARILSSEEVIQRIKNFDRNDLDNIHVLSFGTIAGSSYSDLICISRYRLDNIFEALDNGHYIFIEMKEE